VTVIDRHLGRELLKFALIAVTCVVAIYLLIDLFEELSYFTTRKVALGNILLYYLYSMPSAVSLLYPVSLVLGVFLVYGQMTRYRELHALASAGVPTWRLFAPAIAIGLLSIPGYLAANEFITIPFNANLSNLRRRAIERRPPQEMRRRSNVYFVGEGGRVYFIREFENNTLMRNFSLCKLDTERRVTLRYDGREAVFRDSSWWAFGVAERQFDTAGNERLIQYDSVKLDAMVEKPSDFAAPVRPIDETSTRDLARYIGRMRRAGESVAKEEVEYHYRLSYSLIGLVVMLLGLPVAVRLRRGGVMFGLGLGLLLSFLYWGAIQTSRAFGTSHVISPAMAAWLPNIVFGGIAVALVLGAERRS
jgi:lipopolysaccharide export system permease protein